MKKRFLSVSMLAVVIAFCFGGTTNAAEIGFASGVLTQPRGEAEIFSDQKEALVSTGIPLTIFFNADGLRIGYNTYDLFAKDIYSSWALYGDGTAHVRTNVLSIGFQKGMRRADQTFDFYGLGGIGLFQSIVTMEAILTDGRDFRSVATQRKTADGFNVGFLLGAGLKKTIGNGFIGAEFTHLNAKLEYEKIDDESELSLDVGGSFITITTGVKF
jgi:hypothetical protein